MKRILSFLTALMLLLTPGITPAAAAAGEYSIKEGDIISFGSYEQDNDLSNGKEPIEWLILKKSGSSLLLISRYALDRGEFHADRKAKAVTWETSDLRKWLNGSFLTEAFDSSEQKLIRTVTVKAEKNPQYGTSSGKDTKDKVFLLSIQEANSFFPLKDSGKCAPTRYAYSLDKGRDAEVGDTAVSWWLRTAGKEGKTAEYSPGGYIIEFGEAYTYNNYIRPAVWVDASGVRAVSADVTCPNGHACSPGAEICGICGESVSTVKNPVNADTEPGAVIEFGSYFNKAGITGKMKSLEWLVLDVDREEGRALVITKDCVDSKAFNNKLEAVTWEESSLRTWLNGEFFATAFSGGEQDLIAVAEVAADKNPDYKTKPGNAVTDRIFILSVKEAEEYFADDSGRRSAITAYAANQAAFRAGNRWWLRTPGMAPEMAAFVSGKDGRINTSGCTADDADNCVRPAMWIKF